jgi:hypothetical protein
MTSRSAFTGCFSNPKPAGQRECRCLLGPLVLAYHVTSSSRCGSPDDRNELWRIVQPCGAYSVQNTKTIGATCHIAVESCHITSGSTVRPRHRDPYHLQQNDQ